MSNPEEYITYEADSDMVVRHETEDGAEQFAEDISYVEEVFVQVVETDDMDNTFNTFRDE